MGYGDNYGTDYGSPEPVQPDTPVPRPTNTQYRLENADDEIIVNGETTDYPNVTLGETETFEFYLKDPIDSDTIQNLGGTASGLTGFTASGPSGASLSGTKNVTDTALDSYHQLKEYQRYAGYASTNQTFGGVTFSENGSFADADIDGLVISVRPGSGVDEAKALWGVITGMDDTTEIFGAIARISMELFVLGEVNDYPTETDIRDAFEADF